MTDAVVAARGLAKRYGGVTALADVDLDLQAGEIHGLVGENGAGKSTLLKILCGVTAPDEGTVLVEGHAVAFGNARDAGAAGIAFVAQELSLFPDLSVRENLFPLDPARRLGVVRNRLMDEQARPVLDRLGLRVDMHARVGELTLAEQQLLEIGRALLQEPRVLVLDEPTSALARSTVARLEGVLRSLADQGLAILYISHFLEEVMRIAHRVTVMRDSRIALAGAEAHDIDLDRLVHAMIGGAVPGAAAPQPGGPGAEDRDVSRLRLLEVDVPDALSGVTMHVSPGEIVGVAGLEGAGHELVLDLACGRVRPGTGQVLLPGAVRPRSMRHAYSHGVGFIPRNRKAHGVMQEQLLWENVAAVRWLGLSRGGYWQRTARHRARAEAMVRRLRIRGDSLTRVGDLSGGNQQKVVFAKWMDTEPNVMVLDDPTRGVDVRARAEMHDVVRQLAARGTAVLIASSDLAELVELCDRVLVFQRGRLVDSLSGERLDQRTLSTAMNAGFAAPELEPSEGGLSAGRSRRQR